MAVLYGAGEAAPVSEQQGSEREPTEPGSVAASWTMALWAGVAFLGALLVTLHLLPKILAGV